MYHNYYCYCMCVYIYIYTRIYIYTSTHIFLIIIIRARRGRSAAGSCTVPAGEHEQCDIHDIILYTTTNKCLQCLIKMMYTVF